MQGKCKKECRRNTRGIQGEHKGYEGVLPLHSLHLHCVPLVFRSPCMHGECMEKNSAGGANKFEFAVAWCLCRLALHRRVFVVEPRTGMRQDIREQSSPILSMCSCLMAHRKPLDGRVTGHAGLSSPIKSVFVCLTAH